MIPLSTSTVEQVRSAVNRDRLLDTAVRLIEVPSPTRSAGACLDRLASILESERFDVSRVEAGWPEAPAVVCRWESGRPGRTLQFNAHLDTVHLPFAPPRIENGLLHGSGASDMKGGFAAAIEALRVLRETRLLPAGSILVTAHDLHEAPWGDGSQIDRLIEAGHVGDGVLLPEYLCDRLPVVGRGLGVLEVSITRDGQPVHEVIGGIEQPSVIYAGADLVRRLQELDRQVATRSDPLAGRESCFVGRVDSGEIYNQAPVEFQLSGTRRWLPGTDVSEVERGYRSILSDVATSSGTRVSGTFQLIRDAFSLDRNHPLVAAFQEATTFVSGTPLPVGAKPFVDDGNTFSSRARVAAITHGPDAKGAHTVNEEVPVCELERVAAVYALTAIAFCG